MPVTSRSRALLALSLITLAACGEGTKLPTELNTAEAIADVELTQAAFETPQTSSLADLGFFVDRALVAAGGSTALQSVVAAGPMPAASSAKLLVERVEEAGSTPMATIPASALGKVFVWNTTTQTYQVSTRSGAPATGVRFILYQTDSSTSLPVVPLVEVGTADLSREGTTANPAARLVVKSLAGTTVLEYLATMSGTTQVPAIAITGTAGTGPNAATFSLNVGVNVIQGTVTATWRTSIPSRGVVTRTTLGLGELTYTLNGVMQRGVNKVSIAGTINYVQGGQLTVKVGDAPFARLTINATGEVAVTNPDGGALTPEQQDTLEQIFLWFASTLNWYSALLEPLYTTLGIA